jgi:hypothetical protein
MVAVCLTVKSGASRLSLPIQGFRRLPENRGQVPRTPTGPQARILADPLDPPEACRATDAHPGSQTNQPFSGTMDPR